MKKLFNKYKEIIMYLIFGVLTTVVSWGSYTLLANFCKTSVFVTNLLSWIIAIIFAYVTNKLWVFDSKSWKLSVLGKEIVNFVLSRGVTGLIEIFGVPLLAKTGLDNLFFNMWHNANVTASILFTKGIYSKIILSVVVVILNYVFSKLFVFKGKKEKEN